MAIISGFSPVNQFNAVQRLNGAAPTVSLNISGGDNQVGNFARQILADLFNIQGIGQGGLEGLQLSQDGDNGNTLNLVQSRIGGKGGDGGLVLNLGQAKGIGKDGGGVVRLNLNQSRGLGK